MIITKLRIADPIPTKIEITIKNGSVTMVAIKGPAPSPSAGEGLIKELMSEPKTLPVRAKVSTKKTSDDRQPIEFLKPLETFILWGGTTRLRLNPY